MTTETSVDTLSEENTTEKKLKQTTVEDVKKVTQPEVVKADHTVAKVELQEKAVEKDVVKAEVKVDTQAEPKVAAKAIEKTPSSEQKSAKTVEQKATAPKKSEPVRVFDTIVVGAGISGIAAAYKMNQAGYTDYIVLEKADRVGGT